MYNNYVDESAVNSAITKVMLWMVFGLGITALGIVGVMTVPSLASFVFRSFHILMIAQFALVIGLSWAIEKITYNTAKIMFTVYSFVTGLFLSFIMYAYDFYTIVFALGATVIVFTVMSIYGLTTKEDLTKFGNLLRTALISLVIVSLVNMFLRSTSLYWIISYAGVIIFTGLIGYDMQKIKETMYNIAGGDEELIGKVSIIGALNLYLDFINLFLHLLRVLGRRK